ncbi:MICOS complex subunit Mic10-like isoform X1 [Halichondria panicea]|uniref:MICOS complex subunit Mic10-like isoform X1 n=1 Tax=Halichondria panicea TaxID=6063 RepID=UPI00312B70AD
MTERKVASEDEPGEKWDRCIADAIVKTGTGFGLGLAFSLLLFKRRPWPVALGSGFGLGYASSNCQHDFRRLPSVYLRPVKVTSPAEIIATQAPPTSSDASEQTTPITGSDKPK